MAIQPESPNRTEVRPTAASRSATEAAAGLVRLTARPARAAFLVRSMNALARLTRGSDDRSLGDAAGAPSDRAVLLRALEQPAALATLRRDDPLAAARLRGLRPSEALLEAEGGTLPVGQAADRLGLSRQAVDKRRRAGRLIGLRVGRRGYAYPAWRFARGATFPGLEDVLGDLPGHDPWMQVAFPVHGNTWLGGAVPLTELRHGRRDRVREAAGHDGKQDGARRETGGPTPGAAAGPPGSPAAAP